MAEEVKPEIVEKSPEQKLAEKVYDKTDEKGAPKEPEKKVEPEPKPEEKSEQKPEQKSEEKDSKKSEDEKKDEPAKLDLKLPDGSLLDAKRVDEIASFAKEHGLSQKTAQALLERESDAKASFVESAMTEFTERSGQWLKECESDKEIGGAEFKRNAELAKRVIEKFGSQTLKDELNKGFGNYPELVRTFVRIGKEFGEDRLVHVGAQPGRKKTLEEKFYPNTAQK